jgi:PAS domain S-box-containing protein
VNVHARVLYGVPLFHAERLLGVATIGSRKADGFSREEKLLFRALTNRVSALLVEARLQEQRRQTEELLQAVMDAAPAAIQVKDAAGRYLLANRLCISTTGERLQIGRTPHDVYPSRVAEALLENDRKVLAAGKPLELEETIIGPHQEELTFLAWKFPLHDADGRAYAVAGISTDITERKRIEKERAALLVRERLARAQAEEARGLIDTFLSSAHIGLSLVDKELRFRFLNKALAHENGVPVEAHLGRTLQDVNPSIAPQIEEMLREVLRTGLPLRREISLALPAEPSPVRHLMTEHFPVRTAHGELIGIGSVIVDLTELRRAEAENVRLLALLRAVLDQMPGGVVIAEARSREYLLVNQQNELQTGLHYTPETHDAVLAEVLKRSLNLDGSPRLQSARDPLCQVLLEGQTSAKEQVLFQHVDGSRRQLDINAVAVRDSGGALVAGVRVAVDMTEQRAAEERARFLSRVTETLTASLDYEKTLAQVAELTVPQLADWCTIHRVEEGGEVRCLAVRHVDPSRTGALREILETNPLKLDGSGVVLEVLRSGTARLLEDVTDRDLVALARNPRHLQLLREAGLRSALLLPLKARGTTVGVLTLTMADSGRRFTPADRELAQEIVRRATLALDNSRLYREAQEAIRMREDFLSMASHDLRSPLNALQLRVQLLMRNLKTRDGFPLDLVEDSLRAMHRQGARIQTLVESLFDVSRIQSGHQSVELEEFDLSAATRDIVHRQADLLRSAGCEWTVTAEPVLVRGDRVRLERILTNLLSNAAKYGAGSPVEIVVRRVGGSAELSVADHGIGVAAEDIPKLFQRFSRVGNRAAFHGTGLGLWIARLMVDAIGGTIRVETKAGQGAKFIVALPALGPNA